MEDDLVRLVEVDNKRLVKQVAYDHITIDEVNEEWLEDIYISIIFNGDSKMVEFYVNDCKDSDQCDCEDWDLEYI